MAGTRKFPSDLLLVAGLVILTDVFVLVPVLSGSFLRTALGLLLVLFLPGYALTEAFFPAKSDLEGIERIAVSFGLSIAAVPLLGLALNYTAWGIREVPVLIGLSALTLLMCGVAYYKKSLLPQSEAFEGSLKDLLFSLKPEILENPKSGTDRILAVLLVFFILASLGSLAFVIGNPKEGEQFTEFYLLGPGGVAENYPTEFAPGQSGTVIVGIINHEQRLVNYSLEVKLAGHSLPLPENQMNILLADNVTWEEPIAFTPPIEGKNMELEFLLFNETEKNVPYRNLRLWINVTEEA